MSESIASKALTDMTYMPLYLFGMGRRRKFMYRSGTLSDAITGERLHTWEAVFEASEPAEYRMRLTTRDGGLMRCSL